MQFKLSFILPLFCLIVLLSCKKSGQLGLNPVAFNDSEFDCGRSYYYDSVPLNGFANYASISGDKNIYFLSNFGTVLKTDCNGNSIWQLPLSIPGPIIDFKAELNGDGFYAVTSGDSLVSMSDSTVCYQCMPTCTKSILFYTYDPIGPTRYINYGGKLKVHKFDKNGQLLWRKDFSSNAYNPNGGPGTGSAIGLTKTGMYVLTYSTTSKIPVQNYTIAPTSSIPYYDFPEDQNTLTIRYLDLNGNVINSRSISGVVIKNFFTPNMSMGMSKDRVFAIVEGSVYMFDNNLNFISKIFPLNSNTNCQEKSVFSLCHYRSDYSYFFGKQDQNNNPFYRYVQSYQGSLPFYSEIMPASNYYLYPVEADDHGNMYQINDSSVVKKSSTGQILYKKSIPNHLLSNSSLIRFTTVKNNQPFFFLTNNFYVYIIKPNEIGTY